jgi:predicted XRE-type DNA-binding protein
MSDEPLRTFASVWDAIEDTPAQAENMRLRSSLMIALKEHIAREGLSQSQAAKVFGVTQPRVSDLMRGKIDLFGIDSLVNMLAAAGLHVEVRVARAAWRKLRAAQRTPFPSVPTSRWHTCLLPSAAARPGRQTDNPDALLALRHYRTARRRDHPWNVHRVPTAPIRRRLIRGLERFDRPAPACVMAGRGRPPATLLSAARKSWVAGLIPGSSPGTTMTQVGQVFRYLA